MPGRHVRLPVDDCTATVVLPQQLVDSERRWYDPTLVQHPEYNSKREVEYGCCDLTCVRVNGAIRETEGQRPTQKSFPQRLTKQGLATSTIVGTSNGTKKRGSWWGCTESKANDDTTIMAHTEQRNGVRKLPYGPDLMAYLC